MKKNNFLSMLFLLMVLIFTGISCSKSNSGSTYGGGTPPPGGTPTNSVSISDFAFASASLTIAKGVTVTWTNNGASAHTVTSDDGTSFDSGNIAPGYTYTHTFNTAGTFAYHCSIHPSMTASVIVTP